MDLVKLSIIEFPYFLSLYFLHILLVLLNLFYMMLILAEWQT